jgi:hypothetical protein
MTLALTVFIVFLIFLSSILRTEAGRIGEVGPSHPSGKVISSLTHRSLEWFQTSRIPS